ncbi:MAG: alkaline phosphatase family protein [Candidatus Zixiibacteriota bacterium]
MTFSRSLLYGLVFGILSGLLFGYFFAIWLVNIIGYNRYTADALLLSLYIVILTGLVGLFAGVILGFLNYFVTLLFGLSADRQKVRRRLAIICLGFGIFAIFDFLWLISQRPVFIYSLSFLLGSLVLFVVSFVAVIILSSGAGMLFGSVRSKKFLWIGTPLLAIIIFLLAIHNYGGEKLKSLQEVVLTENRPDTKLIILGFDSATLKTIDPLVEQGRLPNFEWMMKEGSYGVLESEVSKVMPFANSASRGMRSPSLWESIATGKCEKKHGIFDFQITMVPTLNHHVPLRIPFFGRFFTTMPTISTVHYIKRVWEILDEYGISSGVIRWFTCWPADELEYGFMVSDRLKLAGRTLERIATPPELQEALPDYSGFTMDELRQRFPTLPEVPFVNASAAQLMKRVSEDATPEEIDACFTNLFRQYYSMDIYFGNLSLDLYREHHPTFYAVYFYAPDVYIHPFWKFYEPQHFDDVTPEQAEKFGDLINQSYIMLDEYLGRLLEMIDANTTVMIISDHGAGPWIEEGVSFLPGFKGKKYHPAYTGSHRQDGIVIMWGKNVKDGVRMEGAEVHDITPTMLTLLGFPVAEDMDGRVLREAIDDEFLRQHPIRTITSYETEPHRYERPKLLSREATADLEDRLRALGYLR